MITRARLFLLLLLIGLFAANVCGQPGTISTYAGRWYPPDGTRALDWGIYAWGVVPDNTGGFYFCGYRGVYYVSPSGIISLIKPGRIYDIALDSVGNLYLGEGARIEKMTPSGVTTTIAGNGTYGFGGDGGFATQALISSDEIAVDASGNVYLVDAGNHRIRKIDTRGIITTVGGTGAPGFNGDGIAATTAQLYHPKGIALDSLGNIFISDTQNYRIRKIDTRGIITTVVGNGNEGSGGDGGPATSATLDLPQGIAVDANGSIYICDVTRVRKVTPDGVIQNYAGVGPGSGVVVGNAGAPATQVRVANPDDVAVDRQGNVFIAELDRVHKVNPAGILTYVAGHGPYAYFGDGGSALLAELEFPDGLAVDSAGQLYISDGYAIRRVTTSGVISRYTSSVYSVFIDAAGNVYCAGYSFIVKISPNGSSRIVAGSGLREGFSGDGGQATAALLFRPTGVVVDYAGNLYINDAGNQRIRKVSVDGVIRTIATMSGEQHLAIDPSGNLYVSNAETKAIYKISPDGAISTIAGNNGIGVSGDGGPALAAQLGYPLGLAVDFAGNLYIADSNRIRMINSAGIITTIAGSGESGGYTGDGGPALDAQLDGPRGLALDRAGNLYVSDTNNSVVRKIEGIAPRVSVYPVAATGAVSLAPAANAGATQTGFARFQSDRAGAALTGFALLAFRQNGVLLSEAGVPATQAFRSGRLYAEMFDSVNTGVAIANPSSQLTTIRFYFTGSNGDVNIGSMTIPPNGQRAAFLDQSPFNGPRSFRGTFSFSSDVAVGVVALRGLTNERGEFLMTMLPVTDLQAAPRTTPLTFPHFAQGDGWSSQLVLTNPTTATLAGTVSFFDAAGRVLRLTVDNQSNDNFSYSLPPGVAQRFVLGNSQAMMISGSIRVTPATNTSTPSGIVIFSFARNGVTVTQAGVPATSLGSTYRLYVESSGQIQTGLAISNPSNVGVVANLTLYGMDGVATGLTGTLSIPANGQVSAFLTQLDGFRNLPPSFQGLLKISSTTELAVTGLRGRTNERGDFLIASTPPTNESEPLGFAEEIFPHFALGGGYDTRFVIYSGSPQQGQVTLALFTPAGLSATF